jgi:hypothetical protein
MGFTLQSDPEHRVVLVTLERVVTEDSALAAYTAVERFIAANGPHSGITDLSSVEKLLVSRNFIWRLAERPPMIPDGMARVVVAPRPAIYGVSRMFQIIRDNRKGYLKVVHSLEEAFNFLRLEFPRFRMIDSDQPRRLAAR